MKPHANTIRRAELERKVLDIFSTLEALPNFAERGIGKDGIKRTLLKQDCQRSMSINTIKSIVDELVEKEIVECVNPGQTTHLRFRLVMDLTRCVELARGGKAPTELRGF